MTSHLPSWTPFDPGSPPALSEGGALPGRVVALVVGEEAMRAGWAGEVALDLAASWGAATGGRVVTADAGFQAPCLRYAADLPPGEGLSDMLLWGGSLQRVARRDVRGGFVVTAGTPIADGTAALATSRWGELCTGCREAGVTLVVVTPASELGSSAIVAEASDVVLLVSPDEDATSVLAEGTDKVRATLGVAVRPPIPAGATSAQGPTGPRPAADAKAPVPRRSAGEEPGTPRRAPARSGSRPSRTVVLVGVAAVVIVIALIAFLLGAVSPPGVGP
jgi:hypothetical protein